MLKMGCFLVLLLCLLCTNIVASDILKNKDFAEIGPMGLPANFELKGNGKTIVQWNNGVNAIEFEQKAGEVQVLVQPSVPLKTGMRYQLSWWVSGDKTTEYMVYFEGNYSKDNKTQWELFNDGWKRPNAQWQKGQFEFVYNSKNPGLPYFGIQIKGTGKLSLKSLNMIKLDEIKPGRINLDKISTKSNGKNKVVSDDGNILQINGKPFFPLFVWGTPALLPSDELFKQLKSNGLNCFYDFLSHNSKEVLDIAYRNNMKVILAVPKTFWVEKNALSLYHSVYEMLKPEVVNHPALFGYYLGDELLWTNLELEPILQVYRFLKKIDPNHPVWLSEAPRNSIAALAEYGRACDIYGVDIYPSSGPGHSDLPEKGLPAVGQYAKRMREAVDDKKPICMVLQGFSWSVLMKDENRKPYPVLKQTRFMAYDSIINGSTILSWWGLFSVDDPQFYDGLFAVTKELYQITDVLTSPAAKDKFLCSDKAIEFVVKETPNGKVIIAANTSNRAITAGFETVLIAEKINVLFENRSLKIEKGYIKDSFEPYAVHIYSTLATPTIKLPTYHSDIPCYFRQSAITYSNQYSGKANWIWFPGKSSELGSKVEFNRSFTLNEIPQEAVLIATADDTCVIKINGTVVAASTNWTKAPKVSITKILRKGSNVITVLAQDIGGAPCGMLFDLQIKGKDGKSISIISDTSWQSKEYHKSKVKAAEIVVPYGAGQWGKDVKTP